MASLGEKLRELRIERNFKQKDISKLLNLSPSAYGHYERDLCLPDIKTLRNIAILFNTSTDYLLGIIDDKGKEKKILIEEKDYQFVLEIKEIYNKYYKNKK